MSASLTAACDSGLIVTVQQAHIYVQLLACAATCTSFMHTNQRGCQPTKGIKVMHPSITNTRSCFPTAALPQQVKKRCILRSTPRWKASSLVQKTRRVKIGQQLLCLFSQRPSCPPGQRPPAQAHTVSHPPNPLAIQWLLRSGPFCIPKERTPRSQGRTTSAMNCMRPMHRVLYQEPTA